MRYLSTVVLQRARRSLQINKTPSGLTRQAFPIPRDTNNIERRQSKSEPFWPIEIEKVQVVVGKDNVFVPRQNSTNCHIVDNT